MHQRGRIVFFVDMYCAVDCVTGARMTAIVASRFQARKAIRHVRARCLEFHSSRIQPARQYDLCPALSGWKVSRRFHPRELIIEAI